MSADSIWLGAHNRHHVRFVTPADILSGLVRD